MRLIALLLAALIGCTAPAAARLQAVASFSILGDMVARIGGERVAVTTLAQPGADPHAFEPTPAHARQLRAADIAVVNGLGFDRWFEALAKSAGFAGPLIVASTGIAPLPAGRPHAHGHKHTHKHGTAHRAGDAAEVDPHVWNAPLNGIAMAETIAAGLTAADAAGAARYRANADALIAELRMIDREATSQLQDIPASDRRVLTSHAALAYLGAAYGITLLSSAGVSTDNAISAAEVARLIKAIKAERVKAYFIESSNDARLVTQIARATGAAPGGELFVEALSDAGGPATTYTALLRHNLQLLIAAMRGGAS